MSQRYGELSSRIDAVQKLGAVVNVMRGTAGSRVEQARKGLVAVEGHAAVVTEAIRSVLDLLPPAAAAAPTTELPTARVLFGAEQGFVGGFNDPLLEAAAVAPPFHADGPGTGAGPALLVVGQRTRTLAAERGIEPVWSSPMPLHIQGIPALADRVVEALFRLVTERGVRRFEAVWSGGQPTAGGYALEHRTLFPLDPADFPGRSPRRPLHYRAPEALLEELTEEHVHAQLCEVALRAFAAENEARMTVMTAARRQVERRLEELQRLRRQLRQEEITAEIIELSTGVLDAGTGSEEAVP